MLLEKEEQIFPLSLSLSLDAAILAWGSKSTSNLLELSYEAYLLLFQVKFPRAFKVWGDTFITSEPGDKGGWIQTDGGSEVTFT